jgi:hypothetical protein
MKRTVVGMESGVKRREWKRIRELDPLIGMEALHPGQK